MKGALPVLGLHHSSKAPDGRRRERLTSPDVTEARALVVQCLAKASEARVEALAGHREVPVSIGDD